MATSRGPRRGCAALGTDDPSRADGSIELVRGVHNADAAVSEPGELRSELVTVVADDDGAVCLGFDGGARHDGTFRIRTGDDDGIIEIDAEAYLGSAVLPAGTRRELHAVRIESGEAGAASTFLERWADWAGAAGGARTGSPYQVGWCSWYQYFHAVTEAAIRHNLALAANWPVDVFQVDDGYQAEIGDWLQRKDTFPSPLEQLAADIARAGYTPGIWIAPFLASPSSRLAHDNPDWIARRDCGARARRDGEPGLGRRGVDPRHDPPRGARPPRIARAHARGDGLALPEARLHVRAVAVGWAVARPDPYAGRAGARRVRRDPARCR